jgi:hypothetical protein
MFAPPLSPPEGYTPPAPREPTRELVLVYENPEDRAFIAEYFYTNRFATAYWYVKTLDCSGCNLEQLPDLPAKLKRLICSNNKLKELPPLPTKLQTLVCDNNVLRTLQVPPSLKSLSCEHNNISTFSINNVQKSKLTMLNMSHNELSMFSDLPNTIQYFNISYNAFSIQPYIPYYATYVNMSYNLIQIITFLPSYIKYLYINRNRITSINSILPPQLELLDCNDNNLTELPELPKTLTTLYCKSNNITTLPTLPVRLEDLVSDIENFNYHQSDKKQTAHSLIMRQKRTYPNYAQILQQGITDNLIFSYNIIQTSYRGLYNNNKYLIHYETFNINIDNEIFRYDYPIITLPKGMVLYTYSESTMPPTFIYNLHTDKMDNDIKYSRHADWKFFFPVPYAIEGLNHTNPYDICNMVYLTEDVRLLALIEPSPLTNETLRDYNHNRIYHKQYDTMNYYNNGMTGPGYYYEYDIHINPELMAELNLQGYIGVKKSDSIGCGSKWNTILHGQHPYSHTILNQLIYKSCTLSDDCDPLGVFNNGKKLQIYNKRAFGIPEIVLLPTKIDIWKTNPHALSVLREKGIKHMEQNYFCYNLLKTIPARNVKNTLIELSNDLIENTQNSLFHIYKPKMSPDYPYTRDHITYYTELTPENVDFNYSYEHASENIPAEKFCALTTMLYYMFKTHQPNELPSLQPPHMMGGRKVYKRKRSYTKKRRHYRKSKTMKRKRGGAEHTTLITPAHVTMAPSPQLIKTIPNPQTLPNVYPHTSVVSPHPLRRSNVKSPLSLAVASLVTPSPPAGEGVTRRRTATSPLDLATARGPSQRVIKDKPAFAVQTPSYTSTPARAQLNNAPRPVLEMANNIPIVYFE